MSTDTDSGGNEGRVSMAALAGWYLAFTSIALLVLTPVLYRFGLLELMAMLPMFLLGLASAVFAIVFGLIGYFRARSKRITVRGQGRALSGIIGGVGALVVVGLIVGPSIMRQDPPIHDITTDTANPPQFVALRDVREAAPNEVDYDSANADIQAEWYPEFKTVYSDKPGATIFAAAEAAARQMGWEIASADADAGIIEATATTLIFGYKDDVVIRIVPTMSGTTAIDVRSASRVGQGDLGANAIRIRAFLGVLSASL